MLALGQQLQALGLAEGGRLDPGSSLARHLMDGWERLGHTLALQYGAASASSGAGSACAWQQRPAVRSRSGDGQCQPELGLSLPTATALPAGGSEAHTAFFQRARGDWEAATQGRDLLTAVRRAFSNVWADAEKQVGVGGWVGCGLQPFPSAGAAAGRC